jgi:hypothetical protein
MAPRALLALAGLALAAPALAGCTDQVPAKDDGPADMPRLRIAPEAPAWEVGATRSLTLAFDNTAGRPFTYRAGSSCTEPQAWVSIGGERVELLPDRTAGDPVLCLDIVTSVTIPPGGHVARTVRWNGSYLREGGEPRVAEPGNYTVDADFPGETAWATSASARIALLPGPGAEPGPPPPEGSQPRIEVAPERASFAAGEQITITATFTNNASEPFTYTSRDTCNDIGVWAEGGGSPENRTRLWPATGPYACGAALSGYTIPPGGSVSVEVVWDGSASGEGGAPFVGPSSYTLHADFDAWSHGLDGSWATEGTAQVTVEAQGA